MAGENIQLAQNEATDDQAGQVEPGLEQDLGLDTGDVGLDADPFAEGADPFGVGADPFAADTDAADTGVEFIENPYGLQALWEQGDMVAKSVLIILVIMSLWSWFIILTKTWEQSRLIRQARQANRDFWTGKSVAESAQQLTGKGNIFRAVVDETLKAANHHEGRLTDVVPLTDWIGGQLQRNVDRISSELQRGLSFLASVGSTAPFIGLFGTVWGIYHALIAIGLEGQASIDKVAGPVGEALIMTAIGLAVAVPAVLGYNWLLRRNKAILDSVKYFSNDLYATLVSDGSAVRK